MFFKVISLYAKGLRKMLDNLKLDKYEKRIAELEKQLIDQKQIAQKLQESERKYKELVENIPDIVYSLGKDTKVCAVNVPAASAFGFKSEDILGKDFSDFIYPDDREAVFASFLEAIETKREWTRGFQFRCVAKDGSVHWMELNSHMRFDEEGQYASEDGILRIIDDQKKVEEFLLQTHKDLEKKVEERASELKLKNEALQKEIEKKKLIEKELRESKEKYRQLFKYAPSAIWEIDFKSGKLTKVNEVACRISGYSKEELLTVNALELMTADSQKQFIERLNKLESGEQLPETVEYQIIKKAPVRGS